jgi:glycerol-3-phosphate cytidylyltransferase
MEKGNKKEIIGYTSGVYDLFHVGHVNLLKRSKSLCDKLIVGVTTDELLIDYKKKKSVIPYQEREEIVSSIKYVDVVVPQHNMDKVSAYEKLKFNIMFVGDDWYKDKKWKKYEKDLGDFGVKIIYFPYTKGTSSTLINNILQNLRTGTK